MFADSPRWSWELAVLCLCLDHEKQQTHTQTWKSVLQSINRIIILRLSGSVRHIKANISHERMSMLSRTREESGLQQRRGESSLMKKLHQSHVLQLVTQRHWRHKEKQISDDRNQKRERETCVGAEAANSTETFLWSNNSAVNSFIPDWTRLSCFRLLFLAARPARWLRPLMTPPETVTPRDGRRQTITNFLLSQSVRDAKTQNSHTVFTTSLLLVETFWGWWNDFPHYFWSGST